MGGSCWGRSAEGFDSDVQGGRGQTAFFAAAWLRWCVECGAKKVVSLRGLSGGGRRAEGFARDVQGVVRGYNPWRK